MSVGESVQSGAEDDVLRRPGCNRSCELIFRISAASGDERAHLTEARKKRGGKFDHESQVGKTNDLTASGSSKTCGKSNSWCTARCAAADRAVMLGNPAFMDVSRPAKTGASRAILFAA